MNKEDFDFLPEHIRKEYYEFDDGRKIAVCANCGHKVNYLTGLTQVEKLLFLQNLILHSRIHRDAKLDGAFHQHGLPSPLDGRARK